MNQAGSGPGLTALAYDIDRGYGPARRADPRILRRIAHAVGGAASVVNIGAGTGSYEPPNRRVVAVEPSDEMIAQRRPGAAPAVKAFAEALPFKDGGYAASMAILTLPHWRDPFAGLQEMRRVSRRRAVVLTMDPSKISEFWFYRYFPEVARCDSMRFPSLASIADALGGDIRIEDVPIPHDCRDSFLGAYWRRPSAYLEARIRRNIPTLAAIGDDDLLGGLRRLSEDLRSGAWETMHSWLLELDELDIGCRLVIAEYEESRTATLSGWRSSSPPV
jgi:SAM-dependent methyltransferase